jgi:hypothetical protein
MDTTKLEPLLQGPMEATGLYVEFFGATLRHGTYLKLKTDRISNNLDDFVEGDIVVGRIISTSVSGGNKGNLGHPDVAKVISLFAFVYSVSRDTNETRLLLRCAFTN